MKIYAIIVALLFVQSKMVAQTDSLCLKWPNGAIKYLQYGFEEESQDSLGRKTQLILYRKFFDKKGNEITQTKFEDLFGVDELESIDDELTRSGNFLDDTDSYSEFIRRGDNLFVQKKYLQALKNYKAAAKVYPSEEYPKQKIEELDKIILNDLKE